MRNGTPDYRIMKTSPDAIPGEHILTDQGALDGFCSDCGLMRMKHEKEGCTRCGNGKFRNSPPKPVGQIVAVGYTKTAIFYPGADRI